MWASGMFKKIGIVVVAMLALSGACLGIAAARYEPVVRPGVRLGSVDVGGMSRDQARQALGSWWATAKDTSLAMDSKGFKRSPEGWTAAKMGVELDVDASFDQIPFEDLWEYMQRRVGLGKDQSKTYDLVYRRVPDGARALKEFVAANAKATRPAKAVWDGFGVRTEPETPGGELDEDRLPEAVAEAIANGHKGEIPLKVAEKRVPDEALTQIQGVVASYSTRFPTSKVTRCSNIRVASHKLNGSILMPGERFSFNTIVGKRTAKNGFKLAGVYVNGRHDEDFGGGICQVSSTLYNAVLLSDLRVVQRANHSLPVAYVDLGRDATVSYRQPDFVFENNRPTPVALSTHYSPGRLTVRVLGEPDPGLSVKILRRHLKSWDNGVKYVQDAKLPSGVQKVVDKGGRGHKVAVTRVVYRDGVEVRRESLGISTYKGGPRIIAVNGTPVSVAVPAPVVAD